jgi:hypothetical protein
MVGSFLLVLQVRLKELCQGVRMPSMAGTLFGQRRGVAMGTSETMSDGGWLSVGDARIVKFRRCTDMTKSNERLRM